MTELIHLLIIVIVLGFFVWLAQTAPIPQPARWVAWAIIFIIALYVLLPLIGVPLPR